MAEQGKTMTLEEMRQEAMRLINLIKNVRSVDTETVEAVQFATTPQELVHGIQAFLDLNEIYIWQAANLINLRNFIEAHLY